jgi:uncharacterized repeat protein (TIGR01451 family)
VSTATLRRTTIAGLAIGLLALLTVSAAQATHASHDVSVTKTATPDPVNPEGNITYTITLRNLTGTDNFSGGTHPITLTDVIPAGTTFVSLAHTWPFPTGTCVTPPPGGTGTVTCTGGLGLAINAQDQATFTLVVKVDANAQGPITNTATASYAFDPNTANNTATVVTNVTPSQEVRPGKGCGDKNHVHEREAQCKKAPR